VELRVNVIVSLTFHVSALFEARIRRKVGNKLIAEASMSGAKEKARLKTFHATMAVTRLEEWCVDAETPEEARALLAAGQGHRCHLGVCLHVQLEAMEDAA
jgi:hypothetical protein